MVAAVEYRLEAYYTLLVTLNLTLTLIVMLGCLCCKKRVPKNDLLGLEGMVKLKNPDEVIVIPNNNAAAVAVSNSLVRNSESQAELNASTVSNADSEKRSSTAAHRSLPDIPVAESNDNGSELYETVADKQLQARSQSPQPSLKKQTSVSQHSSISQADDVSSPYSRVKGLPHDYAKVRGTEHPYAQLNAPSSSAAAIANSSVASSDGADAVQRGSQHPSEGSTQHLNDALAPQAEIPAASAIAGMISASQDLPYMTPPIANQHFSGDSQDSSKGYTSISVREPLANILAQQQPGGKPTPRNPTLSRDANDSHYATVSDDSDETYAAIEDPNNRHIPNALDIYTSGSETYAQIQPMQANPIVVAVEINNSSSINSSSAQAPSSNSNANGSASSALPHRPSSSLAEHSMPVPPPVDSLRAQMHSRQASSSSNNSSSVCQLGSPKPEKRQANSPLPPTPKSSAATSTGNLTSARNSVISVISVIEAAGGGGGGDDLEAGEASPQRKHSKSLSPSKDIEGMYAKVMKKHKFSRNSPSSQHSSPIMTRKQQQQELGVSPLDSAAALLMDAPKLSLSGSGGTVGGGGGNDKSRVRSNSYSAKDHGYETIPADGHSQVGHSNASAALHENRKSDCYAASMLQKERQQQEAAAAVNQSQASQTAATASQSSNITTNSATKHYETIVSPVRSNNDPGYEQLHVPPTDEDAKKESDYDPNYEVLKSRAHSDDGYAKVLEKKRPTDAVDGSGGYSTILNADANHNYASILETKAQSQAKAAQPATETDHYARIAEAVTTPGSLNSISSIALTSPSSLHSSSLLHNSSTVTTSTSASTMSSRQTPISSQYESLTGSETDPNYESVCYLQTTTTTTMTTSSSGGEGDSSGAVEHAYERLQSDTPASSPLTPEAALVSSSSTGTSTELLVEDYFQV